MHRVLFGAIEPEPEPGRKISENLSFYDVCMSPAGFLIDWRVHIVDVGVGADSTRPLIKIMTMTNILTSGEGRRGGEEILTLPQLSWLAPISRLFIRNWAFLLGNYYLELGTPAEYEEVLADWILLVLRPNDATNYGTTGIAGSIVYDQPTPGSVCRNIRK